MAADTPALVPPELAFYQKSMIFRSGFYGWHILAFVVGIIGSNFVLATWVFDKPAGGTPLLDPKQNEAFQTYLWTTVVLFVKVLAMPWTVVYIACGNNSFTRNPEDLNTGRLDIEYKTSDPTKERINRIHANDLENVPFMIVLGLLMVLVNPSTTAANFYLILNLAARLVHTLWYAISGSHEIRATLWSINCFCMIGYCFQIILAIL